MRALLPSLVLVGLLAACSGRDGAPIEPEPSTLTGAPGVEPVDPDGPHALGTIIVTETRVSGAPAPTSRLEAAFAADGAAEQTCTRPVASGCELVVPCPGVSAPATSPFDAGTVTVTGDVTLSAAPPYASGSVDGAAFTSGASLRVSATGAAGPGFAAFEARITGTTEVRATPALAEIPRATLWGAATVPVTWAPGHDTLTVIARGAGGTIRCAAEDVSGRFDLPRAVVKAALGSAQTLELSLIRERHEVKKGFAARSEVGASTGWLALATSSAESASFTCVGDECAGTPAAVSCQDCRTALCKAEFDACSADATCPMLRTCLDDCTSAACRSQCFVKWPQAAAKQKNAALYVCQCTTHCSAECKADCS
ncbi:MAG: Tryptophan synthase alpha chain [Labilithrix sp.]|nr:Tryptophan synthase alpha chain [Labilithrix sp.]